jgi:predicted small secreted protein
MAHRTVFVLVALGALAPFGCHNTWEGVKEDTHTAVQKTGEGVEKVGEKIEGADKGKPATPPKTDSGP